MQMRTRLAVVAFVVLSIPAMLIGADDPFMGTWKSRPAPGGGLQSNTRINEPVQNGIKVTQLRVDAQGKKSSPPSWTAKFDGTEIPMIDNQLIDHLSLTHPTPYTIEIRGKRAGKPATEVHWEVSKDGKTLTTTTKQLANPNQPPNVQIFDKQ
jgi:hypothetical protein